MKKAYLKTAELAERWGLSTATLRGWRLLGKGPAWFKVGKNVRYDMKAIRAFEQEGHNNGAR